MDVQLMFFLWSLCDDKLENNGCMQRKSLTGLVVANLIHKINCSYCGKDMMMFFN